MKENYKAWEINFQDFENQKTEADQLRFLIKFAVLAPSSHNSQPWRFEVGKGRIKILADMNRALPESDTNHRQLYISLGCALENLLVAADYYGFDTNTAYAPQDTDESVAAVIALTRTRQTSDNKSHQIFSILKRHTNRNPYSKQMPAQNFVNQLKNLSNEEVQIDYVTDQGLREKIADVVLRATAEAMKSKKFRKELSAYVVSNISKSPVGMPGFGMNIPTPISLAAPKMLKLFNMSKMTHKQDEALLKKQTPAFVVISSKHDDKEGWLRAGQKYEQCALLAEQVGLKTAVMAAAIQINDYYKELQSLLGIALRPQVFFRLGYTDKAMKHSPRLSTESILRK